MSAAFFRGTNIDKNVKFKDKEKALIKSWKWPEEFEKHVDLKKVDLDVIKQWIEKRVNELMGIEEELVVAYAQAYLDDVVGNIDERFCPKKM